MTSDEFLSSFSPEVKALSLHLTGLIRKGLPGCYEKVYPGYKTISYGIGEGKGMDAEIVYISPLRDSVNLGFYRGTVLTDPNRMLKGSGKMMRHTKFRKMEEIDDSKILSLLQEAAGSR